MGKQASDLHGLSAGAQHGTPQVPNGRGTRESLLHLTGHQGNANEPHSRPQWICSLGWPALTLVPPPHSSSVKWVEWSWPPPGFQEGRGRSGGAPRRNRASARKPTASFPVHQPGLGGGEGHSRQGHCRPSLPPGGGAPEGERQGTRSRWRATGSIYPPTRCLWRPQRARHSSVFAGEKMKQSHSYV